MQQKQDQQFSKDSAEVSNMMMQKEKSQQQKSTQQSNYVNEALKEISKKLDDTGTQNNTAVVINNIEQQTNSATMGSF